MIILVDACGAICLCNDIVLVQYACAFILEIKPDFEESFERKFEIHQILT